MRFAFALARLNIITLSEVVQRFMHRIACFRALTAAEHSLFHHGANGLLKGLDFGIAVLAASIIIDSQ